jgi:hypothetical protein
MSQGTPSPLRRGKQIPRFARNDGTEHFFWKNWDDSLERSKQKRSYGFLYTAAFWRE